MHTVAEKLHREKCPTCHTPEHYAFTPSGKLKAIFCNTCKATRKPTGRELQITPELLHA